MKSNTTLKKAIGVAIVIVSVAVAVLGIEILPEIGDVNSPANTHVSQEYIEASLKHLSIPSLVTAIIADYRAFDTLMETAILFIAGLAVVVVLSEKEKIVRENRQGNELNFGGLVINSSVRILIPVILLYALYVLIHGRVNLGGGFQAGALIAIAYTIDRFVPRDSKTIFHFTEISALCIAGTGSFIFVLTGVFSMINGGNFLEYGRLGLNMDFAQLHSLGVSLVELGITMGFMGAVIDILEAVLERAEFDE